MITHDPDGPFLMAAPWSHHAGKRHHHRDQQQRDNRRGYDVERLVIHPRLATSETV